MSDNTEIWLAQLLSRYIHVVEHDAAPSADTLHALNTLQLADALLDKSRLSQQAPQHALQVAIIGPTQSGKSTLVNILLDSNAAGISALAGFTVHAQGYATGYTSEELAELHSLMAPLERVPANQLDAENLNTYVLEPVEVGRQHIVSPAVVWDTPDFDSIDASTYTRAVLNTVAIADVIILMVSKDKYGDKSVWDMLSLTRPLHKPMLVCINKLDAQDEQTVANAFRSRYEQHFNDASVPPLTLFPFVRKAEGSSNVLLPEALLEQLRARLHTAIEHVDRSQHSVSAKRFLDQHHDSWFKPLIKEQQATEQWQAMVAAAAEQAEEAYVNDYLNNPDKYDTFNLALAELLTLLELPGFAPALAKTRQVITWPARKLLGFGRTTLENQFKTSDGKHLRPADQEADTLERLLNAALVSIQSELLEQPQSPYWLAVNQAFREHADLIRSRFLQQSEVARREFAPEIEAAAQKLYEQLQDQPALLNTLRAARVTADAAGVALALKSGGLAPADLVLAPAMLSVTTLLTESALGKYLDTIRRDLQERQRQHINSRLIQGVLVQELDALVQSLPDRQLFTQQLEPELQAELDRSLG